MSVLAAGAMMLEAARTAEMPRVECGTGEQPGVDDVPAGRADASGTAHAAAGGAPSVGPISATARRDISQR